MFGPTETADGYVMIAVASEKTFQGLMGVIGRPEWITDPRFATYADRARQLGRHDGRRRGLVAAAHDRRNASSALNAAGVPCLGLSHRARGAGRSAARAPAGALVRGGGRRRHVQGAQSAVPDVGRRQVAAGKRDGRRSASTRDALRGEIGLADDAPIPSGKMAVARLTTKADARLSCRKQCGFARGRLATIRWPKLGQVQVCLALQPVAWWRDEEACREDAMKSFKVADFNAPLKEVDQPTPQPTGTQVLIKVKAAGVCHSDLHIWEGGYDLGHGRKPLSLKDRGVSLPLTMGHETVGEIVAFGPDVKPTDQGGLKLGDVALVYPWIGCGKCATCLAGDENMCLKPNSLGVYCDGGYADHMTVPHPSYLLNLKGLDPVTAAPYACSGVTTYSALKKVEKHLRYADRDFRRRRPRPDGAVAVEGDGRQGRDHGRYRRQEARGGGKGRRARDRRWQGAGCAGAAGEEGRRADPRRDRPRRQRRRRRSSASTA